MTSTPRPTRSRSRLRAAVGGVAALAVPLLPAGSAHAVDPLPPVQDTREFACPPGHVPPAGFTDVAGSVFDDQIDCFASYGFTKGVGDGSAYDPGSAVRRANMAVFIYRVGRYAGVEFDTSDAGFSDIGSQLPEFRDAINGLANAEVVQGRPDGTFGPGEPVRRDQMAAFIARLQEQEVGAAYPAGGDYFSDEDGSLFEAAINALARAGVVQGTSAGSYTPVAPVTRQQMALFLTRYLDDRIAAGDLAGKYPRNSEVVTVEPADEVLLDAADDSAGEAQTGDDRTYTATGLREGVEYRITLVQAVTTRRGDDGTLRFLDEDEDRLAEVGSYTADLVTVNGQPVERTEGGPKAPSTATAVPAEGRITFTVDGEGAGDRVVPVVYRNAGTSPRLELAGDLRPVELFGVGGVTAYRPGPAAASGNGADGDVTSLSDKGERGTVVVDTDNDRDGDLTYAYDETDNYRIDGDPAPQGDFLDALSRGDRLVVGAYAAQADGVSTFDLTVDAPTAPAVTVEKGELGQNGDDLTVTVVPAAPTDLSAYDEFVLERAPVTGSGRGDEQTTGTVGSFTEVARIAPSADADLTAEGLQHVDRGVPNGSYRYRAAGVLDGDRGPFGVDPANETSTPPTEPDTTRPKAAEAVVSADQGGDGSTGPADELRLVFDEAMSPAPRGALIRVRGTQADGSARTVDLVHGDNAFFDTGEEGSRTLTVTVRAGTPPVGYPLTVVAMAAVLDANGNTWDVPGSPDRSIEVP